MGRAYIPIASPGQRVQNCNLGAGMRSAQLTPEQVAAGATARALQWLPTEVEDALPEFADRYIANPIKQEP